MGKVSAGYRDLLFKIFLTLIMSLIMSITITFLNLGLAPNFFEKWVVAFVGGFVVSFPAILIAVPTARRIVKAITVESAKKQAF